MQRTVHGRAPPSALLPSNLAELNNNHHTSVTLYHLDGAVGQRSSSQPTSSTASCSTAALSVVSDADPTSISDRHDTTQAASSYSYLRAKQRQLKLREMDRRRSFTQIASFSARSTTTDREDVAFHKTDEEYGLTREEREWLWCLYNRYRLDAPHEDALKELLWNVDRESMDDQQLHAKLQGTFPASTNEMAHHDWFSGDKEEGASQQLGEGGDLPHLPPPVLTFEQLLDYAVMVKSQCAAKSVSDQMTLDAFVLLGGCEDGSGEVQLDTLRKTIVDFQLNIDVESFVAAVDKDGDGTITYKEFAWLYNEGLNECTASTPLRAGRTPSTFFNPKGEGNSDASVATKHPKDGEDSPLRLTSPTSVGHHHHSRTTSRTDAALLLTRGGITHAAAAAGASMRHQSLLLHGVDVSSYVSVSPSKRSGGGLGKHGRARPMPVHCKDLPDPESILQRLDDVAFAHENRLAFGEQANRKHVVDAQTQGNHLLAKNVYSLFFGRSPTSSCPSGTFPSENISPRDSSATVQATESEPSRRSGQRVSVKAKLDQAATNVPAATISPRRRIPTISELVQRKLGASTPRTMDRRAESKCETTATAQAVENVQRAMSSLQTALRNLEQVRRGGKLRSVSSSVEPVEGSSARASTHEKSRPAFQPEESPLKADAIVSESSCPARASPGSPRESSEEPQAGLSHSSPPPEAHAESAADDSYECNDFEVASSRSSSRRSSRSSSSFSIASTESAKSAIHVSSEDTVRPKPVATQEAQPATESGPNEENVNRQRVPHPPCAPKGPRLSGISPAPPRQQNMRYPLKNRTGGSAANPTAPSCSKHAHLLVRRPQTASSQSRLCRTTSRAFNDGRLARENSTSIACAHTTPQRIVETLRRCAAEGNAVTLVAAHRNKSKANGRCVEEQKEADCGGGVKVAQAPADMEAALIERWTRR